MTQDHNVRVRFAPSPTGALHVGAARAALFNWLYAKHVGGTFILRIEDTDAARSTEASAEGIYEGLKWLGLEWDEGPDVGGDAGPYLQSQRIPLYEQYAQKLLDQGMAYRCFCTQEELEARRKALQAQGKPPKYDRRCFGLSAEDQEVMVAEGRPSVIRFYSTDEGETVFEDMIRGQVRFANHVLDDFVIMRSDALPTYNFAVVIDDHLMDISHVIRGEDHISNTPRQIQVYEALDLPVPAFAHLPMILGPDRAKLSKRHGARSVMEFAADGYLPEAVVNYLALLGWSFDDAQEFFTVPDELIEKFGLDRVSKNPAIFDLPKFEWMNAAYIRELAPEELAARGRPLMEAAGLLSRESTAADEDHFVSIVRAVQSRIKTLNDLVPSTEYFFAEEVTYDEKAVQKFLHRDYVPRLLAAVLEELMGLKPFTEEAIQAVFDRLETQFQLKKVDLMQPVRVAVTGSSASPGMYETLALLGRAKACHRLRSVLAQFKQTEHDSDPA